MNYSETHYVLDYSRLKISGWNFDNSYKGLDKKLFTRLDPTRVPEPKVAVFNEELAEELGLNISERKGDELAEVFSGNKIPEGAEPIAQAYAGHQFGHFTMLGDGRAHLLGEHITPGGLRRDIQFKGSGQTPYSRSGDGRATLISMLREYLVSECMHHLRIPGSRSLAVVLTGESVPRERVHPGAVLTRVSRSHIRVGTFEYIRHFLPPAVLGTFLDYTIQRHYPKLTGDQNPALALLQKAMEKQIDLVVNWMRVGFIHGVMNTDNTTISGETIDYGPCAFMNTYHPNTVFSSIDTHGRYSFGNQIGIAHWNMGCFAGALLPLIDQNQDRAIDKAKEALSDFGPLYRKKWNAMMRGKLGLIEEKPNDEELFADLLKWMERTEADYTNTFRYLSGREVSDESPWKKEEFQQWKKRWETRLQNETGGKDTALQTMQKTNPNYIPRNHLVEEALEEAGLKADFTKFNHLMDVLKEPYSDRQVKKDFNQVPVGWDEGYRTFCGT